MKKFLTVLMEQEVSSSRQHVVQIRTSFKSCPNSDIMCQDRLLNSSRTSNYLSLFIYLIRSYYALRSWPSQIGILRELGVHSRPSHLAGHAPLYKSMLGSHCCLANIELIKTFVFFLFARRLFIGIVNRFVLRFSLAIRLKTNVTLA